MQRLLQTSAVVAALCVTIPALAERDDGKARSAVSATRSRPVGEGATRAPSRDAAGEVSRRVDADLDALGAWFEGSPVGHRADAQRNRKRRTDRREREVLARFEATQRGRFDDDIAGAARLWDVDPFLLKGLLLTESRLDPKLIGDRIYRQVKGRRVAVGGGARGIAQFTSMGIAAVNEARGKRHRAGEHVHAFADADVWKPRAAIYASAELLRHYIDRFGRDGGITAYNSGPYGGRLVQKHGFHKARRAGLLRTHGRTVLQGHRFLTNVLNRTNRLRRRAKLRPLPMPRDNGPGWLKKLERLERLEKKKRRRSRRSS